MALLSFSPTPEIGTTSTVTLDKTELEALPEVLADAYFSDPANIRRVGIIFRSESGGQDKPMLFDYSQATPTSTITFSSTARLEIFQFLKIIIQDFDNGELVIDRSQFDPSLLNLDLDLSVPPAPISLLGLLSTPELALWYNTDTLTGYSNLDPVNSVTESSGTVWNASADLAVVPGGYSSPLYITNAINGHAALEFSYVASSSTRLAANITITNKTSDQFQWFFVVNLVSAPGLVTNNNKQGAVAWGTDNFFFTGLNYGQNSEGKRSWGSYINGSGDGAVSPNTLAGEWLIVEIVKNGTSLTTKHHRVGPGTLSRTDVLGSATLSGYTKLTFGPPSNFGGLTFQMAESAFYKTTLTTPQRDEVIAYFSNKYLIPVT